LLIAPDGSKLSKRKHGPVVSVTTYRDAGFLPHAFANFVCLLGWSPKDDREVLSRQELIDAFSLEGVNHSNATINFSEQDPFDPKAVWLECGAHPEFMPKQELAQKLLPFLPGVDAAKNAPGDAADSGTHQAAARRRHGGRLLLRQAAATLRQSPTDRRRAMRPWRSRRWSEPQVLSTAEFTHDGLDARCAAALT
jgi:hypothetical protein